MLPRKLTGVDPETERRRHKIVRRDTYRDVPGLILAADADSGVCLMRDETTNANAEHDFGPGGVAIVARSLLLALTAAAAIGALSACAAAPGTAPATGSPSPVQSACAAGAPIANQAAALAPTLGNAAAKVDSLVQYFTSVCGSPAAMTTAAASPTTAAWLQTIVAGLVQLAPLAAAAL